MSSSPSDVFLDKGILGAIVVVLGGVIVYLTNRTNTLQKDLENVHKESVAKEAAFRQELITREASHQNVVVNLLSNHKQELVAISERARSELSDLQSARISDAQKLAEQTFSAAQQLTRSIDLVSNVVEKSMKRRSP